MFFPSFPLFHFPFPLCYLLLLRSREPGWPAEREAENASRPPLPCAAPRRTALHVPIEFDAIDLTIATDILEVLGSDQHCSEVSPQRRVRAVGRKLCKRSHDASAQVKAGGSSRATSTRRELQRHGNAGAALRRAHAASKKKCQSHFASNPFERPPEPIVRFRKKGPEIRPNGEPVQVKEVPPTCMGESRI